MPQKKPVDIDILIRQADQAMYQAKLTGKAQYRIFNAEDGNKLRFKYKLIEGMSQALKNAEFCLYYQPKVNMQTGKVLGVEALIRWQHPTKYLLEPNEFLPVLAGNPFMIVLGNWVLENALKQMEHWLTQGIELKVSVNIDSLQLQEDNFCNNLQNLLAKHPTINPKNLELELLEGGELNDLKITSKVIDKCQAACGVSFTLDDFGTGFSSLTYLQKLPVTTIKIAQNFIQDLHNNTDNLATIKGAIKLAEAFELGVIIEGIDTIEHGEVLIKMGCPQAQGYAIARPMPSEELPAWLETWQTPSAWNNLVTEP
ncbi:MAG: GGDEF domain-containing phosphodiesterase [Thiomicrorhabdus sp.]|jgi:EAL domain-containing protein (putative c-di-GMP-specific phosphodiesterase class I)|nr:GGDEF domain-containing phosphodiesterase [Thiomicrorhabdus sp.]